MLLNRKSGGDMNQGHSIQYGKIDTSKFISAGIAWNNLYAGIISKEVVFRNSP
jgi:hypothetical protein